MKYSILLSISFLWLISCNNPKEKASETLDGSTTTEATSETMTNTSETP